MNNLLDKDGLSPMGRMIHRWQRIKSVLTEAPLGLNKQIEEMLNVVGCDCVLLASSLPKLSKEQNSNNWEWIIHRAVPTTYNWLVNAETHLIPKGFKELALTLTSIAKNAQQSASSNSQMSRLYLYNDWGCESIKLQKKSDEYRSKKDFILTKKQPILVGDGAEEYSVTHIGLILLGAVSIGQWGIGESYLVFLDLVKNQKSLTSRQWIDSVEIECVPFLAYLAEVDSHFDRLFSINKIRSNERQRRMEQMTSIELDAYCHSANRLTPLLEIDLPLTIETLIQMLNILDYSDHGMTCDEVTKLKEYANTILAGFSDSSYLVLEDSRRIIPSEEMLQQSAYVQQQINWTRIWWNLEMLFQQSTHHHEEVFKSWSSRLPSVLSEIVKLLDNTPAYLWFHSGKPKDGELTLNGPCLAGFLVTQALNLCRNRIDPGLAGMNLAVGSDARALETLVFARKLVCVIRYAIGCVKGDEEVLRSLLWLLSEIGHDQFGIDRRLDFEHHLCLAAMEQPALYGLKSLYRDHLSHVLQVCLTGWMFLESQYSDNKGENHRVMDIFRTPGSTDQTLFGQWFVASLLHDVGYVIDIGIGWTDLLERFGDPVLRDLSKRGKNIIKEWSNNNNKWMDWHFNEEDKPGEDHGIVSALHVQSALEEIPNCISEDYECALNAIAHHNHLNISIPFEMERLTILLVLCDELQEWDRPWLDLNRAALALSTMVTYGSNMTPHWYKPLSKVSVNIKIAKNPDIPSKILLLFESPVLNFKINYRDDIHRNHSIFNAWLGRTRSLQRIKLGDNCPLDFCYHLQSPVAPPNDLAERDPSEPELTRLWRIVRDKRVWSIHKWMEQVSNSKTLPEVGRLGEQGVAYMIVGMERNRSEIVTLDVRKLGENNPISDDLREFWNAVVHWKHAGESINDPV